MDQNQVNDAINVPVSTASSNESMNQNREFSIWQLIKTLIVRCVIVYVIVSFFKRDQTQNTSTKSRNDNENIIATNLYKSGDNFDLYAYISELKYFKEFDDVNSLIWKKKHLIYDDWGSGSNNDGTYSITKSIPISKYVQNNGTIFLHVFIIRSGHKLSANMDRDVSNELIYTRHQLNKYKKVRYVNTKNLLTGKTEKSLEEIQKSEIMQYEIKSFWHRNATINVVVDQTKWHETKIPAQLSNYIKFVPSKNMYKPIVYVNTFWNLLRDYTLLNESVTEIDLTLTYQPISLFKWQFYVLQGDDKSKWTPEFLKAFNNIENDDDQDSLKETLLRTSPYLLLLTLVVTILHYFFELLAFKNDIQFWNNRDSLEGLSVRCVFFNAFQALIVLLYVLDNEANFMIRFGCFVGLGIECWKIIKVVDIKFDSTNKIFGTIPIIKFLDKSSYVESSTREYDLMAFRYLSWICFPLFIAYGTYSLIYDEHTGWYSFILSMSYGFLLTFSFIMMTPQLFINYKMKSVAHLPWRMMTYKFLNTFIDDIFAFIIKMPTLHRLRCFRDDIVFVVFLYQRWIYKVDNKRINEFGVSGEMLQQNATQTITVSENDKKND